MAFGCVVELREANAFLSQGVYVRRVDLAPIAAKIGIAEIVYHHQKDVGPVRLLTDDQRQAQQGYGNSGENDKSVRGQS